MKVKRFRLKNKYVRVLKVLGIILCIILGIFIFYNKEISDITKYGYSREASKNILFSFKKDYAISHGNNKTLNAAFESKYYNEKYLDNYSRIDYVNQKNLIRNINRLIDKGYTNDEIELIITHGNDNDVSEFTKRDKVKYLDDFYDISYAKIRNYDRYLKYSDLTGEDNKTVVLFVNLDLDREPYKDPVKVNKFSYDMLVNKHRYLDKKFKPSNLVKINSKYTGGEEIFMNGVAYQAFVSMAKAASREGYGLVINSAYRSYDDQKKIEDSYRNLYGDNYVTKYVARAGFSEHQTGLGIDVGSSSVKVFSNSKEYKWMIDNAYKYGFILRFPLKFEDITLIRNEPWHFRYVGKKISKYIYENNISFEEYYAEFLDK